MAVGGEDEDHGDGHEEAEERDGHRSVLQAGAMPGNPRTGVAGNRRIGMSLAFF